MVNDCLFCKIIEKKIPSRIVYEDDKCLAFQDINPQAPVHILFITKRHIPTPLDIQEEDKGEMGHLFYVANQIARKENLQDAGFRTVVNCKSDGGQTVYHLHLHLLGGRQMTWPPG